MTRKTLARQLGVTVRYVRDVENGRRLPSYQALCWLCELLDVLPSELVGDPGPQ